MEELKKLEIDLDFLDKEKSKPKGNAEVKSAAPEKKKNDDQPVRPWIRYWARYLDIIVISVFIGIFFTSFFTSLSKQSDTVLSVIILFIWVFVESIFLSSWGTTPGKWLLKIRISNKNGEKITFSQALNRSFNVWFRGLGLGVPFISLFTHISAYNTLTKTGETTWDKDGEFVITHKKIGIIRGAFTVIIFIFALYLISIGES